MTRGALVALAVMAVAGVVTAQLRPADAPPPINDTRCGSECVRCAADGCVKCARLLVLPEGTCTNDCPTGTRESWAQDDHLMGRVCYPTHTYNENQPSSTAYAKCRHSARTQAQPLPQRMNQDDDTKLREFHKQLDCLRLIVGGACGAVACIALVAAGAAYAKCRQSARTQAQPLPQRMNQDDDTKLREFHKQLDCLRPHAYTLLAILNHTRHQVRDLYQLGNNEAAMAYSCILSDLAKLLILLNKHQVPVVPEEWPRLASWAERILKRYSRMNISQAQDNQLVNFLPSPPSQTSDSETTQQSFTTFKPPSYSPTSYDSTIDKDSQCEWSDVRPPSYSQIEREIGGETIDLSDHWERRPIVRRESVWLEDELFEMTRRPQDELTTEL